MEEERVERRLAAILAADVVGFSRMMEVGEERTMKALRLLRREFFDPTVAEHKGRIFKVMGDGLLIEFGSVIDAARCGIAIQTGMPERNRDVPEERQINLRIGINLGDIIVDGDDFYGDGVNLAARLEGLAQPGGIACSAVVRHQIGSKIEAEFIDQGKQTVKNITQPLHVYYVNLSAPEGKSGQADDGYSELRSEKPTLAVLPFENMSNDPEQEYFASGIVEDLIAALSRFPWLSVASRNSSFAYAEKTMAVRQIARELGVRYVLEGSVRSSSTRLRVSVSVLDTTQGRTIWAEKYDRPVGDLFDLQDDISQSITGMLVPALSGEEQKQLLRSNRPDLSAWEAYQKGLAHYYQPFTVENHARTRELFDLAIEKDQRFSEAHAMIAMMGIYALESGNSSYTASREEVLLEARQAADRAVEIDDLNPVAHIALGRILEMQGHTEEGIDECRTAVRLNPNLALAHHELGFILSYSGLLEESVDCFDTAIRLSPNDPSRWNYYLLKGFSLFGLERFDEAIESLRHAARLRNPAAWSFIGLTACYVGQGRIEEAKQSLQDILERRPDCTGAWIRKIVGHGKTTYWDQMIENLFAAGLPKD